MGVFSMLFEMFGLLILSLKVLTYVAENLYGMRENSSDAIELLLYQEKARGRSYVCLAFCTTSRDRSWPMCRKLRIHIKKSAFCHKGSCLLVFVFALEFTPMSKERRENMKTNRIRLISIICVFAFVLTSLPLTVLATESVAIGNISDTATVERMDSASDEIAILGEIENMREESVKYFRREDGSIVAAMYDAPVHFQVDGVWKDIDNTLVLDEIVNGVSYYKNTANNLNVRLPDKLSSNSPIRVTHGSHTLQWHLIDGQSQTAQVLSPTVEEECSVTRTVSIQGAAQTITAEKKNQDFLSIEKRNASMLYTNVYADTHLRYDVNSNRFKESIVLNRISDRTQYVFEIQAEGLTASLQEDGAVYFFAPDQEAPVFVIVAPYMYDSNHEYSNDIQVQLTSIKNGYRYILAPSQSWLRDSEREYPVVIDPTIVTEIDSSACMEAAQVYERYPDRPYGQQSFMYAGSMFDDYDTYNEYRSLIKLNLPEMVLAPNTIIVNATLVLTPHAQYNNSDGSLQVNLHNNTESWSENNVTWNTKPAYDSQVADYAVVAASPISDPEDSTRFDITDLMVRWVNGTIPNYGVTIKTPTVAEERMQNACWYSDNVEDPATGNDAHRPHALITFREGSGIESYWTYTGTSVGRDATMAVNNATGTLTAVIPDCGVDGNLLPVSISHVYNASAPFDATYGGHWRLNYQMKIESAELRQYSNNPMQCYIFTDGDGTKHYLLPTDESADAPVEFKDEDGLGLTLIVDSATASVPYTLRDQDKNEMRFNSNGDLTCIRDVYDHQIVITYDNTVDTPRITKITDGAGRAYNLVYLNDRLASITDEAGRVTAYTYEGNSLLTRVTYPDGVYLDVAYISHNYVTSTGVETLWRLKEFVDNAQSLYVTYTDAALAQVSFMGTHISNTNAFKEFFDFQYYPGATTVTDISGCQFTYQFNEYLQTVGVVSHADGRAQSFTYGAPGGAEGQVNRLLLSSDVKQAIVNRAIKGQIPSGSVAINQAYAPIRGGVITGNASYKSDYGHTANGCIQVSVSEMGAVTDPIMYATQYYTVTEDGYYTLSAFVSTNGTPVAGENGARVRLVCYRDDVEVAASHVSLTETGADEWRRLCTSLECQAGDELYLQFGFCGQDAVGTAYYDDIQLEVMTETANEYNLLSNTDFYRGTDGWTASSGTWQAVVPDAQDPMLPAKTVKVYKTTGSPTAQRRAYQTISVTNGKKGDTYSMGAWAKADSLPLTAHSDSRFGICLEFNNTDGTTTTRQLSFNSTYHEWQIVAGEAIAEKDYSSITFSFEYTNNANTAYFSLPFLYRDNYGQSYTYDKDGNVISATDQTQNQFTYAYNDQQLAKLASPTGSRQLMAYDKSTNALLSVQTTDGQRTEFTYDNHGNVTSTVTGADDFVSDPRSGGTYYLRNVYTGNVLAVEGNTVASHAYVRSRPWDDSALTHQFRLSATQEEDVYYLLSEGNTGLRLDVELAQDTDGAKLLLFGQGETVDNQLFKLEYHEDTGAFFLLTAISGYTKCVDGSAADEETAEDGDFVLQQTYDPDNERQQWYLIEVNANLTQDYHIVTESEYTDNGNYLAFSKDSLGNETQYVTDLNTGNTQKVITPDGEETTYGYDASGLHQTSVNTDGHQVNYTYYRDLLTSISVNGRQTYNFTYDSLNRTDQIFVGSAVSTNMLVDYDYNLRSQLERMIYGNGNIVNYSYDTLGRLENVWYNNNTSKTISTVYNERGMVGLIKDALVDTRTRFEYDLAGRVVRLRRTLGAATDSDALFAEVAYDYEDSTNRLLQQRVTLAAGIDGPYSYTTGYTYGNFADGESPNRVYGVTYNGTTELEYTYDDLGRLLTRTLSGADLQTQYYYQPRPGSIQGTSPLVYLVSENGVNTSYAYDAMGNITEVADSRGRVNTYAYDDLNQLVSANLLGNSYTYTYDDNGNILTAVENGVTHTYTYGDSRWRDLLTAYDGQTFTYDQIGNPLTYRNGMRFSWQNGRQLKASLNPGSSITTYTYNADGTRHSKSTQTNVTKTTNYYYVEGVLYAVENADYTVVFQFDETGTPYGFRLLFHDGSERETLQYYKYNLQGDVVGIYDTGGNEVVTYTYDPWGKLLSATGIDVLIDANPLLYRGYVYDKETGFYYCNSRYYDPETGRWLNADCITDGGAGVLGYDLFIYAANNPVNNSDETGQWIIKNAIKWLVKNVFKPRTDRRRQATANINRTITLGLSANATCGIGASMSGGITIDAKGNIGFVATTGGVGGTPAASVNLFATVTTAPDIYKQNGPAYPSGASADICGIGVGVEYTLFTDSETQDIYHGGTIMVGGGAPIPLEVHTGISYSWVWGFNIYDTLDKMYLKIMEW